MSKEFLKTWIQQLKSKLTQKDKDGLMIHLKENLLKEMIQIDKLPKKSQKHKILSSQVSISLTNLQASIHSRALISKINQIWENSKTLKDTGVEFHSLIFKISNSLYRTLKVLKMRKILPIKIT
jgi:hypothetical protein